MGFSGFPPTPEAAKLVAAGRSITEPSVQAMYRAWARAVSYPFGRLHGARADAW